MEIKSIYVEDPGYIGVNLEFNKSELTKDLKYKFEENLFSILDKLGIQPNNSINITEQKLLYLINKIDIMNNAVDNGLPSSLLLELRRTKETINSWFITP